MCIINKSGITIRLKVSSLRVMGRATQGVRLINLEKKNDQIASVCKVDTEPEVTDEESVASAFISDDNNNLDNEQLNVSSEEQSNGENNNNENN